jgi:SAM-dependent methyltransferase
VALAVREHLRGRGRPLTDATVLDAEALAAAAAALPAGSFAGGPSARQLWRPPAYLETHAGLLPPPERGGVLDLGAGSGRGAVWLALRGYSVTAVDRLAEARKFGRRLAASAGVRCEFLTRDLRDPLQVPPGPWAALLLLRFFDRPLLARLPDLLLPGGVVVIRCYRRAGPPAGGAAGHLVGPGELARLLPPERFELLAHREDDEEEGRPAAGCVARLRSAVP